MKRYGLAIAVHLLLACAAQASGVFVSDDRGRPQWFDGPPQRIVSVFPSLTESVCALGACARLVGVDRYSNWPARVKSLPQLGGGLDLNVEAIVRLRPDVVLASTSSRAGERLEQLGIKVLMFQPSSHEQVKISLHTLDQLLGTQQADALWRAVEEEFAQAAKLLPPAARGARVYFEVDQTPYAAGEASFIGQTLKKLGLRNIVDARLGAFPKINPEFVVAQQPDVIVLSEQNAQQLPQRPGWTQLKALRTNAVCELTAAQADLLVRSGPRLAQGAKALAQCLARVMK